MASAIHQGNVFDVLPTLTPRSIDCAVTSPPYWMLRSYLAKGHPLKSLELGQEKTPAEYVANMVRVFALVRAALADHGTVWINVGDTYCDDSKHGGMTSGKHVSALHGPSVMREKRTTGVPAGNRALVPERLLLALQEDGWIVRSVVCWHKPAPMPISVAGWRWVRCRVKDPEFKQQRYVGKGADGEDPQSPAERMKMNTATARANGVAHDAGAYNVGHLGWLDCQGCKKCQKTGGLVLRRGSWRPTSAYEPVIMLAKSTGYFADGDAVKQPASAATVSRDQYTRVLDDPDEQFAVRHDHETVCDGANLRDVWRANLELLSKEDLLALLLDDREMSNVWTIASEPLREKHYAAYPTELVERCLLAGTSSKGYCGTCGAPWARVVEMKGNPHPHPREDGRGEIDRNGGNHGNGSAALAPEVRTIDWRPSCACADSTPRPGMVLDPFSGSGRTGVAASRLGLDFTGIDLNPEYVEMSKRVIHDENPLFAGIEVEA